MPVKAIIPEVIDEYIANATEALSGADNWREDSYFDSREEKTNDHCTERVKQRDRPFRQSRFPSAKERS